MQSYVEVHVRMSNEQVQSAGYTYNVEGSGDEAGLRLT